MAQANDLKEVLIDQIKSLDLWEEKLQQEIPNKWEKHGNCALFPPKAFTSPVWQSNPSILETAARVLKVEKLARKSGPIKNDDFRCPTVQLLFGSDPIVLRKENGIKYTWDITKCMFSSGNITEKQRISKLDCRGQVVVDLYAGIGYFTLTYLVHAKADLVYACEWNPESVKWLDSNVKLNDVAGKCVILPGDNLETCPKNVANHVNLGLIPSSEASWGVACAALKRDCGGILHIHGNVDLDIGQNDDETPATPAASTLTNGHSKSKTNGNGIVSYDIHGNGNVDIGPNDDDDETPTPLTLPNGHSKSKTNENGIVSSDIHGNVDTRPTSSGDETPMAALTNGRSKTKTNGVNSDIPKKPLKTHPKAWITWSNYVKRRISEYFKTEYPNDQWIISISDIVKIKSYGPKVDHLVIDVKCIPQPQQKSPSTNGFKH